MSKHVTERDQKHSQQRLSHASAYSARVQEAMRYNKLGSTEYPLVMTLLNAVLQGYTEERWKDLQQQQVEALTHQPPEKNIAHADAAHRYEQTMCVLKDLQLWPW